jgi:D-arabinose 1-dehydrogenase-like Zn-dependent alcohol dehydrogenase
LSPPPPFAFPAGRPNHTTQPRGYGFTANTRQDAREFLDFAASHRLSVTTHPYELESADRALADLKAGRFDGAAVLVP